MLPEDQKEFESSLDAKIETATQTPEAETPGVVNRKRGRPKGRKDDLREPNKSSSQPLDTQKPVPPVDENEAKMFAQMFAGLANMFVKEPYKEKLRFTEEELLNVTRPAVQLKAYYMPNFGGIYAVWTQFTVCACGLGFQKYNIIREIMKDGNTTKPARDIKPEPTEPPPQLNVGGDITAKPEGFGIPPITPQPTYPVDNFSVAREEDNSHTGNEGNGQVYPSEGAITNTETGGGL